MKNKIDRFFKKNLDIPQPPPNGAWEFIQQQIGQKEKKRIFPFWTTLSGIAVVGLLIVGGGFVFDVFEFESNSKTNQNSNAITKQSQELNNNLHPDLNKNNSESNPNWNQNSDFQILNSTTSETIAQKENRQSRILNSNLYENNLTHLNTSTNNYVADFNSIQKESNQNPKIVHQNNHPEWNTNLWNPENLILPIEKLEDFSPILKDKELIAVNSNQNKKKKSVPLPKKKIDFDRFYISGFVSPMALNSFVGNSMLADEMGKYRTENNVTLSYGVKGAYALSPRIKIRTGVTVTGFEQLTKDVPLAANIEYANAALGSPNKADHVNIKYHGELRVDNNLVSSNALGELNNKTIEGNLRQQSQYIEIPVEAEIALFKTGSIGISATGGGSTWLLSKNKIYVHTEGYTEELGKADNLNKTSFSANAGMKFDMMIMENVQLNLEPNFKYLINPVNDVENFNPYTVGVNAGVTVSLK